MAAKKKLPPWLGPQPAAVATAKQLMGHQPPAPAKKKKHHKKKPPVAPPTKGTPPPAK